MENILGAQPVYEVGRENNNGMFGGDNMMWFLILILIMGGNGNGGLFGGNRAVDQLTNEALLGNINTGLNTGFNSVNKAICDTNMHIANGFGNTNTLLTRGFCETNLNLVKGFGDLTHQSDLNTCRLETAVHAEGEATRALITTNRISQLESENNALRLESNNASQTNSIINAIRPYPVQAVPFGQPYTYPYAPWGVGGNCCW